MGGPGSVVVGPDSVVGGSKMETGDTFQRWVVGLPRTICIRSSVAARRSLGGTEGDRGLFSASVV